VALAPDSSALHARSAETVVLSESSDGAGFADSAAPESGLTRPATGYSEEKSIVDLPSVPYVLMGLPPGTTVLNAT